MSIIPPAESFLDQGLSIVTGFLGEYSLAALVVLAAGIAIGLGIWGTMKVVSLGRKSAK